VETERGYYLLQLKERIAGSVRPFEEVKGHAARSASEQLRDRKVGALVDELKQGAGVEVYADGFKSLRFDDGTDLGLPKKNEASRAREALNQEK
jgi:parvulin-like peptidyl-prolyl isomerase